MRNLENVMIRQATEEDARQIADIVVEDWKKAYRGIIDQDYLDSMSVEERYSRELKRYQIYRVAISRDEVLGFTWNEMTDDEAADCEIIAIYIRYARTGYPGCGDGEEYSEVFTWILPCAALPLLAEQSVPAAACA